jgi:DNA-binding NtrC family response regulator
VIEVAEVDREPLASGPLLDILLVEDERDIADPIGQVLTAEGHRVSIEYDGQAGMDRLCGTHYDLVISDIRLPQLDGLTLFQWVREHNPDTAVILMSAYGSIPEAVSSVRRNAVHYLRKPFELDELLDTVKEVGERAQLRRAASGVRSRHDDPIEAALIGHSAPMVALKNRLKAIADSDAPILIHGETGTGKDVAARAIHQASSRRTGPFVAVNCGAFPETLIEAELFGHERGAFTGAVQRRDGRFSAAEGGTLFLDEVTEMPAGSQVKLLRVLQEGVFQPLGSNRDVAINVRILSATNKDVRKLLDDGQFRKDLFYRVRVLDAHVPPLRTRGGDLPLLVGHFLGRFTPPGEPVPGISVLAWALLREYPFPGNVRELEHAVHHAMVLCRGAEIDVQHLPDEIRGRAPGWSAERERSSLADSMADYERILLLRTLEEVEWNRSRAAALLGVSRKCLWEKLKKHQIQEPPLPD